MEYHSALMAALIGLILPIAQQNGSPISLLASNQSDSGVARQSARPDLAVKISDIARFRITSPKTVYRLGETITVNMSILSSSQERVCFLNPVIAEAYLMDKKGNQTRIRPYLDGEIIPSAEAYILSGSGRVSSGSRNLFFQCGRRSVESLKASLPAIDQKSSTESIFPYSGCLDVKTPGTYTLFFEITNWLVVVRSDQPGVRTAVGTLKSNKLTITLTA